MIKRAAIVIALLLGTAFFAAHVTGTENHVDREPLAALPHVIDSWRGREATPLADDVVALLGVDDYIHRVYVSDAGVPVGLYAGYYGSQRQGDTIHSPQNCLPGAGWQPVEGGSAPVDVDGRQLIVNRYVIQKGLDRQVVLYWYQGRGRVVANEYANKFWLMLDAARLHRSDGSLVRVVAPVLRGANGSVTAADGAAIDFTRAVFPRLSIHLP